MLEKCQIDDAYRRLPFWFLFHADVAHMETKTLGIKLRDLWYSGFKKSYKNYALYFSLLSF